MSISPLASRCKISPASFGEYLLGRPISRGAVVFVVPVIPFHYTEKSPSATPKVGHCAGRMSDNGQTSQS